METFFQEIDYKIRQAVEKDFQRILTEVGKENIYAIALVTDSDGITLFMAVNTYEYLEKMNKKDRKRIKSYKNFLSKEKIEKIKNGSVSFTKWIPDEWGYSDEKNSELNQISKLLFAKEVENSEEYARHIPLFIESITSAFKHLIQSKVFGENSEEITYFISMSDDERTVEMENKSAKLLNSEHLYKEFIKRNEFWE